jgi:hypothetical protein
MRQRNHFRRCIANNLNKENSESKSHKDSNTSEKKRKRKSESQPQLSSGRLEGHIATPTVDQRALYDFKSTTPKNGDILTQSHDASDKSSRKKIKSNRKSAELNVSLPQDSVISVGAPVDTLVKKSKKSKDLAFVNTPAHDPLQPQPLASTTVSPYITIPKKTPIPLPRRSTNLRTTTPVSSQPIPPAQDAEILVVETPPSKLTSASSNAWKTPVRAMQTHIPVPTAKLTRDNLVMSKSAVSPHFPMSSHPQMISTLLTIRM